LKIVISEIQVRTLFEEGWSEIDHRVRYPNFSDNPLLAYFLNIFNRMSGSADEMGSFLNDLTLHIAESEKMVSLANAQTDEHLEKIELLVSELEAEKSLSSEIQDKLKAVNKELSSLRPAQNLSSGLGSLSMGMDYEKWIEVTNLNQTYDGLLGISEATEKAMMQLSPSSNISALESLVNLTPSIRSNKSFDTLVKSLNQEVDASEQTMKKDDIDS